MKNVPENELFSAYLDGELTAEEQAQIERLLASSPAARQLMEELRALSGTLQSLPVHKLGEDLAPQVLRVAERRMLGEPASGLEAPSPSLPQPAPDALRPLWRTLARRVLTPRTIVWPGVAVAVALLIMVFGPQGLDPRPGPRQVAVAPKAEAERPRDGQSQRPPSAAAIAARETEERDAAPESAAPPAAPALPPAVKARTARSAGEGMLPAPDAKPADRAQAARRDAANKAAIDKAELRSEVDGLAPGAAAPLPKIVEAEAAAKGGALAGHPPAPSAAPGPTRAMGAWGGAPGAGGGESHGPGRPGFGVAAAPATEKHLAKADADRAVRERFSAADGTMLVICDLSPGAVEDRAFDELLARQQIAWDGAGPGPAEVGPLAEMVRGQPNAVRQGPAKDESQEQAKLQAHRKEKAAQGPAADLDLVLVEATPQQIEAALAAIQSRPEDFVRVKVAPSLNVPAQEGLRQFERGYAVDKKAEGRDIAAQQGAVPAGPGRAAAPGERPEVADGPPVQFRGRARRLPVPLQPADVERLARAALSAAPAEPEGKPAEETRKEARQAEAPAYRVLFVLRAAEAPGPLAAPPAAAVIEARPAESAKE